MGNIRSAVLTSNEMTSMVKWPDILIEDYLNMGRNVDLLAKELDALRNIFPGKGFTVTLDGNNSLDPIISNTYNLATVVRTSVGVYRITIAQSTFNGVLIGGIGTIVTSSDISPSLQSDLQIVEVTQIDASNFDVKVQEIIQGAGSSLDALPYDIKPGDRVSVALLLNQGDGTLPAP